MKRILSSLVLVSATLIPPSIAHATETQIVRCSNGGTFTIVSNVVTQSSNCSGNANIPSGVTSVGNFAFRDATGITSVTISTGVTSIGAYSFSGLPNLLEVKLPATVESIGIRAFQYSTFVNVVFGEGMKSIGSEAFQFTGTNWLEVPASMETMDRPWGQHGSPQLYFWGNAPSGEPGTGALIWTRLNSTGFNVGLWPSLRRYTAHVVRYDENQADFGTPPRPSLIASGDPSSAVATNPGNLSRAGFQFIGWNSLQDGTGIDYPSSDPIMNIVQDTTLYAKWEPLNELSGDIPCSQGGTFQVVSNGVWNTGDDSMLRSNCAGEAVVPEGVTKLGWGAFFGATNLQSIKLPNSLRNIDYSVFSDTGLRTIVIPSGVTHLNPDAFYGLEQLQSIQFLGSAPILTYDLSDVSPEDPTSEECVISRTAQAIVPNTASGFALNQSGMWCGLKVITETAARETAARETAARETAARETAARETAARETAARETAARETAARETAARETADLTTRTLKRKSNVGALKLAKRVGITFVSPKAKVSLSVAKASKGTCSVSGAKLKTLKAGICVVTFTVQEPKPKGGKKPKATKTTKQLVIQ